MRKLLTIFFLLPLSSYACIELQKDSIKLEWTGYKTATKAGVKGTFKEIKHTGKTKGKDLKELLTGATLDIAIQTPSSGDAARDANLKNSFFKLIGEQAKATVKKVDAKHVWVDLTMGEKTVEVALAHELEDGELELEGTLDIFDFALNDAFASLNKQCRALHEGKTWTDVAIDVTAKVTACK